MNILPGKAIRLTDKDVRELAAHVVYHMEHPQVDPIRGNRLGWSYVRFVAKYLPILIALGYLPLKKPDEGDTPNG